MEKATNQTVILGIVFFIHQLNIFDQILNQSINATFHVRHTHSTKVNDFISLGFFRFQVYS